MKKMKQMKQIIGVCLAVLLFSSCGTKKFDKEMNVAYANAVKTAAYSSIICGEISSTWHKAIYDHEGPSGNYCSDFNKAISDLSNILDESGITDSVKLYKRNMETSTSKISNPPKNRKECYDDLVELVSETSQFASMATDPSGSLTSYNAQRSSTEEKIMKLIKKFNIKYSDFITVK